jgi:uncharacterized protein
MTLRALLHNQKLKSLLKMYRVRKVALFGSHAYGKPRKNSDIDLLIDFAPEADLMDQVGLQQDLSRILKRKVDVVTRKSLSKYFRNDVLKKAVYL